MSSGIKNISCERHIIAPEGESVWAGASYTRNTGQSIVENIRHEALHFSPQSGKQYFLRRAYRRYSHDNGKTWPITRHLFEKTPEQLAGEQIFPLNAFMLPAHDVLVDLFSKFIIDPSQPMFGIGNKRSLSHRSFYQLSKDGGETWSDPVQVVDSRPGYNETLWGPGLEFGEYGGVCDGQPVFFKNGSFVIGFTIHHKSAPPEDVSERVKEIYSTVVYAQVRPDAEGTRLNWRFSERISVPFPVAAGGCCEPCATHLTGDRILNTMRCQGDERLGIYSSRQATISEDGGMTWSKPFALSYDDGKPVWTPASVHKFFTSSKNGRTYALGNFLDRPVHGQVPRYPLCIAELDTTKACLVRKTLTVIQDLPPGAPVDRRYTNWGQYEERGSNDLILLMPEQPAKVNFADMTTPADYTGDCLRFRISFE